MEKYEEDNVNTRGSYDPHSLELFDLGCSLVTDAAGWLRLRRWEEQNEDEQSNKRTVEASED